MNTRKELARVAAAVELIAEAPTGRNTGHETGQERTAKVPLWARLMLAWGGGSANLKVARRILDDYEIVGLVGPNGGGKTLALMVLTAATRAGQWWECDLPFHEHTKQGITSGYRKMLSTVPILDGTGDLHPLYEEFTDFQQLLDLEHGDGYMDEVVTVASSRESARMDPRVLVKLNQLRKDDVFLYWTAPNLARADKSIREVTKALIECRGYAPAPASESGPRWRSKRVFKFTAYDAVEFESWTAGQRENATPLRTLWFNGTGSAEFRAYDTLSAVSMVRSMTPENTCTVCDGTVVRHRCTCNERPRRRATTGAPPVLEPVDAGV